MPAVTVENPLVLPRITRPDATSAPTRPVDRIVASHHAIEGAGFEVWRPFPGGVDLHRHVGEHELEALEVGDRVPELLALLHVLHRQVERALREPERLRTDERS